jgi:o-succinylbenzoate synthase
LCAEIVEFPSIVFGIETALLDLRNGGKSFFYNTSFTRSETKIPINGLIWMGDEAFMQAQIEDKLQEGYRCIKMKIGAIDFDKEFAILESLRKRFPADQLTLRVDANGAFSVDEALERLTQLSTLEIHSIEQPIQVNQWEAMAELCQKSPLPIALDEELIGIHDLAAKRNLLETIQPQYIILKPSLHGGIAGTKSWIEIAEKLNIPWWITSALESNVGLNHIAQFTSTYDNLLFQGLGTGGLYVENTPTKMQTKGGFLEMIG